MAEGNFAPKSRFLGNSIVSIMEGKTTLTFLTFPHEPYIITNPNVYARGVMFGKMYLEIGDAARISCESTGLFCEINFKVKVWHARLLLFRAFFQARTMR